MLKLEDLMVQSFVTALSENEKNNIIGGHGDVIITVKGIPTNCAHCPK